MLHRFFAILLCLILAAGLVGCAAEEPALPEDQPAYEPPQIVEEEPATKFELFEPEPDLEPEPAEDEESDTVDMEGYIVKPAGSYYITTIDSSEVIFIDNPRFDNVLTFPLIQVTHTNEILGEKINDSIIEASRWMSEVLHYSNPVDVGISLQSERYLSFIYGIGSPRGARRADTINYPITIDMQTGKRVMLNDLVNTNLEFAERVIDTSSFLYFYGHDHLTPNWLLEQMATVNFTAREIYEHPYLGRYSDIYSTMSPLLFRRIFFLNDAYIIIVSTHDRGPSLFEGQHLATIHYPHIKINLSDIQDFLLVDSW